MCGINECYWVTVKEIWMGWSFTRTGDQRSFETKENKRRVGKFVIQHIPTLKRVFSSSCRECAYLCSSGAEVFSHTNKLKHINTQSSVRLQTSCFQVELCWKSPPVLWIDLTDGLLFLHLGNIVFAPLVHGLCWVFLGGNKCPEDHADRMFIWNTQTW